MRFSLPLLFIALTWIAVTIACVAATLRMYKGHSSTVCIVWALVLIFAGIAVQGVAMYFDRPDPSAWTVPGVPNDEQ